MNENNDCSNSLWIKMSITSHRKYLGKRITYLCEGWADKALAEEQMVFDNPDRPKKSFIETALKMELKEEII